MTVRLKRPLGEEQNAVLLGRAYSLESGNEGVKIIMIWLQEGTKAKPPGKAMAVAQAAAQEFEVPVGVLLGTVECETNFRLGMVSAAGAVGPCQFLPRYRADYARYAGFAFDLAGWESIRGLAAVYRTYAGWARERHGMEGEDAWRFALCAHRWGQNDPRCRAPRKQKRVADVERKMRLNGVWYDAAGEAAKPGGAGESDKPGAGEPSASTLAARAAQWALGKVGCPYDQARRAQAGVFDCSSLVARAYGAQGVKWDLVGGGIPTSTQEVYSDQFELLWPESYEKIGKAMGGASVLRQANQPGDLQFLCTNPRTDRKNRITHVTIVADGETIVHAKSARDGVREDKLTHYAGKACAVARYNPACTLRKGMRGLRVKALQERLNARGARLETDGVYGPATERAAKQYGEE